MTAPMRAASLLALLILSACGSDPSPTSHADKARTEKAATDPLERACAASATYDRLKGVVFDEARRVRKVANPNFDRLAASAVVRMEDPVVTTQDDPLTMIACKGRFIVELPPGVTDAFDGDQRLSAEIDYVVRKAADGSGFVYEVKRAEPIVYRLAAFDLTARPAAPEAAPIADAPAIPQPVQPPPSLAAQRPVPRPSYDCRYARSRVEIMICNDERLAALDRRMAAQFDDAVANADRRTARIIRRSREPFLAWRDDCRDAACVADAYRDRIAELRDYPVDENR